MLQWIDSSKHPKPYEEGIHHGVVRISVEVDDIEASYMALKEQSLSVGYDIRIGEVEVCDFGPELGARKVVNFQDPEDVGFQLIQQPLATAPALHPWGVGAELS